MDQAQAQAQADGEDDSDDGKSTPAAAVSNRRGGKSKLSKSRLSAQDPDATLTTSIINEDDEEGDEVEDDARSFSDA